MNWLRRFMMGRYGGDQLSLALLILSFLLAFIARIARLPLLVFISYIPVGICVFRMLSRDTSRRSMENYKFMMIVNSFYSWIRQKWGHIKNSKTRRYFKCPYCAASLWVPKGKGKIIITCPKCKTQFKRRT
ncbi:MAG: hypothetical protein QME45_13340 [Clostridiales bacterium]|nr:hypothetical protein [Clostridiales bacterium]